MANIDTIDLNLLRLFDAVYRTRNVSRAAEELGLSQPATSQALTRLRLLLRDPLFERVAGGVRPTARSERLAHSVQAGLALLEAGLNEGERFDPATTDAELRLHLSDIGEGRFLPPLMTTFARSRRTCALSRAPGRMRRSPRRWTTASCISRSASCRPSAAPPMRKC